MDYESLKNRILQMKLGATEIIYSLGQIDVFVHKPTKVKTQLKQSARYDPKRNFQIGLIKPNQKSFLPNHLRILMDLDLKKREDPKKAKLLFDAIENIYNGEDPMKYLKTLSALRFDREIENSFVDLCLSQLFFIEQDLNYTFGKVLPPRDYLMGYIRMVRLGVEEIDKLLWGSTRHPPRIEFRSKDCLNKEILNNSQQQLH